MDKIFKYPRTPHISTSRLQKGDEDLNVFPIDELKNKFLVIEEKIDGANSGISFSKDGDLLLQSRGHYLTGGYRERHFNLFKSWANANMDSIFDVIGTKYIIYGEWMYAKHTIFYDKLPHYFMEFDIYDKEKNIYLSTKMRRKILSRLTFINSVPVIFEGYINNLEELTGLIKGSLYKSDSWLENLKKSCGKLNLDFELAKKQTNLSDLSEGLYIKHESDIEVLQRFKYVRQDFIAEILSNDSHWLERPIIPNILEEGKELW